MKAKRYVLEGTWSGDEVRQSRLVHRTVHSGSFKKLRAWAELVGSIRFTDGTYLKITISDCRPHEYVTEIKGYTSLIRDCALYGVASVEALNAAMKNRREGSVNAS